jgi:acetolactate synthase-1/2/3 large subunit
VRSGGRILVDQLRIQGVDTVFCVPGESYLAALDALADARDSIRLVVCRQEGGAANMAEAYGKLTGRPGVCFVTRGPGATNASIGVHTARQDSTPLLLLVGQVAREALGREAFQEVDFVAMFAPLAKHAEQVADPTRIPEIVSRAFHTACAGRPGPVVLAFPEDVLVEEAEAEDVGPYRVVQPHPGPEEIEALRDLLAAAERPLLLLGGAGWTPETSRDIVAFAEASNLPAACAFRRQDCFDNRSHLYAGDVGIAVNPRLAQRIRDADLLLVVGPRLGEATTSGYTLLDVPRPRQKLVHVHPDPEELGRVYQADLPINSGLAQFAAAVRALAPVDGSRWASWTEQAHADYLENLRHEPLPGDLDLGDVMAFLRERLPPEAILTNGAGNFSVWAHRFYQFSQFRTQLGPTSGAMGYGVPAAIAAKLLHPDRIVISFSGDGDFLMTGQELATAVREEAAAVFLVINNGMYGTIRAHQEREFPGRAYGTDLVNPDFAAYARAFGAHGEVVERTEGFPPAFERALAARRPAVLELRIHPEAISARATLTEIREAARSRR